MQVDYFFMTIGVLFIVLMIHLIVTRIFKKTIEGLQSETTPTTSTSTTTNGIGANSPSYDSSVAVVATSLKDQLGISTYYTHYDSIIENQISILYNQMLQTTLSLNVSSPDPGALTTINQLHSTILALDDLKTFVDKK
jgi:hypothetical protein